MYVFLSLGFNEGLLRWGVYDFTRGVNIFEGGRVLEVTNIHIFNVAKTILNIVRKCWSRV